MAPSITPVASSPNRFIRNCRAPPKLPSVKTLRIVSPMFVIAATTLSKMTSPASPNTRPTTSRTLSRLSRRIWTAATISEITPTTGSTLPRMPLNGPKIAPPVNARVATPPIPENSFENTPPAAPPILENAPPIFVPPNICPNARPTPPAADPMPPKYPVTLFATPLTFPANPTASTPASAVFPLKSAMTF